VDSAEADQVGSQRIRFCAYVGRVIDKGVRHYRTTPGASNSVYFGLYGVFIAGRGSYRAARRRPVADTTVGTSATTGELAAHD
jgi:hypothetical protein